MLCTNPGDDDRDWPAQQDDRNSDPDGPGPDDEDLGIGQSDDEHDNLGEE